MYNLFAYCQLILLHYIYYDYTNSEKNLIKNEYIIFM